MPLAEWRAESLRLTLFAAPGASVPNAEMVYRAVSGKEPDTLTKKGVAFEASGFDSDTQIVAASTPVRLDIIFRSKLAVDETLIDRVPVIGPLEDSVRSFNDRMVSWLASMDELSLSRAALGVVAVIPEESREAGYVRLANLIPVKIDTDSNDLLYQINRRRHSKAVESVTINRLAKWAVMRFTMMALSPGTPQKTAESYSTRLELDINTATDVELSFTKTHVVGLTPELADLALEIAERGDVQ